MSKRILVIGGAHIDRRARISTATVPGASNPGRWFTEPGGGGFNAAQNLARLGHAVTLISPRGGDQAGEMVADAAERAGIDDRPLTFLDRQTPSYTAILEKDGNLVIGIADMELYSLFSTRRLSMRQIRDAITAADLILTDGNMPAETIIALADVAAKRGIPLAAIAISPAKVVRFRSALPHLHMLFMNEAEAEAIAETRPDDPSGWPDLLRGQGLRGAVITRGKNALVAFRDDMACALAPPALPEIADVTGAGDAFASGVIAATLDGERLPQSLRAGAAAAVITLQSPLAAAENMSRATLDAALALVPEPRLLA
ncbi:carbohydrate kinase family protein [Rhizobium sp. NRK18]|uniref:carbohydrate kinase family protein n=1 Tax=Rhizobium sp. NRK18 TaxID=2964667 RepID=UPI0021C2FEEE|nr:carbohydrate kinase family protein [Rhizobium sp. NRK18]MCQ2003953.1 carbohydrate kinase family protein [Rhizobium sp. NRK18]